MILHRTPYGIAAADARDKFDVAHAWLPNPAEPMRGSILRGWRAIVEHGYAAVYQDCRGRHGSEGEDRVYADDAADGHDTLEWIAAQPWSNGRVGMSGSSAGATTTFAAASTRHPSLRAFFAQAGGSSIYDDVVCEGQSIEMERLWLWVAKNIPGLSASHREAVMQRFGIGAAELDAAAERAAARYDPARRGAHAPSRRLSARPTGCTCRWPATPISRPGSRFSTRSSPTRRPTRSAPGTISAPRSTSPGFTSPAGSTSSRPASSPPSRRSRRAPAPRNCGSARTSIISSTPSNFWPRDPYFEWFGYWLKDQPTGLIDEPAVSYSPRAWVDDRAGYVPDDWRHAERWPPPGVIAAPALSARRRQPRRRQPGGEPLAYTYDPRRPVPTLGGRNMLIDPGPLDQRPAQALPDYGLIYRGDATGPRPDDRRQCAGDLAGAVGLPRHRFRRQADRD